MDEETNNQNQKENKLAAVIGVILALIIIWFGYSVVVGESSQYAKEQQTIREAAEAIKRLDELSEEIDLAKRGLTIEDVTDEETVEPVDQVEVSEDF